MLSRAWLVAGALTGAAAMVSLAPAATPIGNPVGVALFSRIGAAYIHVRGVELAVNGRGSRTGNFGRFVIALRDGVGVREAFLAANAEVVTDAAGTTYARQPSTTCWRRLARSDPRTLVDVGLAFPYSRDPGKVMAPTRTASGWRLSMENRENFWFLATQSVYRPIAKRFIVYSVDAANRIVGVSIQALQNGTASIHAANHPKLIWRTARLKAKTLTTAPTIPNPTPVCA